ncbi:MAG TPA: hypothetical protein VN449_06770 [Gaiellaceae bacterium]|jgi:hypothetical protein|nr:hypothetical protein [Gaiellaceae bacterium]
MKLLKVLVGGLAIGALGAAVAFAAPPPSNPGKGPKTTTGSTTTTAASTNAQKPACTPQVMIIVRGTTTADVGTNDTSVSLNVTGGNHFAKLLFGNNSTTALSVNTTTKTQVTTAKGKASTLSSIDKGDRVLAMYKACMSSVTGNSPNVASASSLSTFLASVSPKKVVNLGNANGQ